MRPVAPIVALAFILAIPLAPAAPETDRPAFLPMARLGELGSAWSGPAPPASGDEASVAAWLATTEVLGRTPDAWIASARALSDLPAAAPRGADLVEEVLELNALVGRVLSDAERASIEADTTALPVAWSSAIADLLADVNDAYARQVPLAAGVLDALPSLDGTRPLVSPADRDAMEANAHAVLSALALFEARTAGLAPPAGWRVSSPTGSDLSPPAAPVAGGNDPPIFSDPEGLVVIGGTGDATYTRYGLFPDPVLLVEPGGNDLYRNSAGGACPDPLNLVHSCNRLALSAVLDLAGADVYDFAGLPSAVQGAGSMGGLGILVDAGGNDQYKAVLTRTTNGPFFQYVDGGAQGFGQAGYAVQWDLAGDDSYVLDVASTQGRSIWGFGQGFGSLGGFGLSYDSGGNDDWLSHGLGLGPSPSNSGFQGLYPFGTGFYGGVGLLLDEGKGRDLYHGWLNATTTDYYAQGFGAFGGLGLLHDDGGDDSYVAYERATNPWITELLNCAYGTASFAGVGIHLDQGGHDRFWADTVSPRRAFTMTEGWGGPGAAYGLFVDLWGNDQRLMYAHGTQGSVLAGRGFIAANGNLVGDFLDLGGTDVYLGPGSNNAVWVGGADRDLIAGGV